MDCIKFTVYGEQVEQGRPRRSIRNGKGGRYNFFYSKNVQMMGEYPVKWIFATMVCAERFNIDKKLLKG